MEMYPVIFRDFPLMVHSFGLVWVGNRIVFTKFATKQWSVHHG